MSRFWVFTPWLVESRPELLDKLVGRCQFLNSQEVFDAWLPAGQFRSDPVPVAQLQLTLKTFDADIFQWDSKTLVSESFRQAIGLGSSEIQYFDVDASSSASVPRSKNYQIMHIPLTENVSDPSRSVFATMRFSPESPLVPVDTKAIAFRDDARSEHELFHDAFFRGHVLCSDALALRVLNAGCSGIRFFDPSFLFRGNTRRFRTLNGLEEEGWDIANDRKYMKVIQELN